MFTKTHFKKLLLGVLAIVMVVSQVTPAYEAYAATTVKQIASTGSARGTAATNFIEPCGIAYSATGNAIYVAVTNKTASNPEKDKNGNVIKGDDRYPVKKNKKQLKIYKYKIKNNKYTKVACKTLPVKFYHPNDLTTDGKYLYIADCTNKIYRYTISDIFNSSNTKSIKKTTFTLSADEQSKDFPKDPRSISGISYAGSHKTFIISLHKETDEGKIVYYYVKFDGKKNILKQDSFTLEVPSTGKTGAKYFQSGICYDYDNNKLYTSMCRKQSEKDENKTVWKADKVSFLMTLNVEINDGKISKKADTKANYKFVSPHSEASTFECESIAIKTNTNQILTVARCKCKDKKNHAALYKLKLD